LEIFDFALNATSHITADKLLPGNNLKSYLLAGAIMNSKLDLAKGALTQSSKDLVGADALFRLDLFLERRIGGAGSSLRGIVGIVLLLRLGLGLRLLRTTNVRRGQRNGELFILEASGSHGDTYDALTEGQGETSGSVRKEIERRSPGS
jgi:hypothetical protein